MVTVCYCVILLLPNLKKRRLPKKRDEKTDRFGESGDWRGLSMVQCFWMENMEVPYPFRNLFLCGSNSNTFRSSIFKFGPAIPMLQYRFFPMV